MFGFIIPLLIVALVVYLMVIFFIPAVVIIITHLVVGSAAKMGEDEVVFLGHVFYWVTGLLFAGAMLFNYDLSGWKAFWAFVGMVLLWPFSLFYLSYNMHVDDGLKLKIIVGVSGFVITQLTAVLMILMQARGWIKFKKPEDYYK